MSPHSTPANRKRGTLWAVVTAVALMVVGYFMFFDSREGTSPIGADSISTEETPTDGSRAPVPVGGAAPGAVN